MRHNQVSVLEILQQVTSELDIDQVDVVSSVFESDNAVDKKWRGLLNQAVEWLLTLQVNGTAFLPLLKDTDIKIGYSKVSNTFYGRVSFVNNQYYMRVCNNNQVTSYRVSLFGVKAFVLPSDLWSIQDINPSKAYKIRGNELYMDNETNIKISYISSFAFMGKDFSSRRQPIKDDDICLLDKQLIVSAVKYMSAKQSGDPLIQMYQEEAISRANYLLSEDMEANYGNTIMSYNRF